MVHYEDLHDGDKDVIGKAIEEFQNKCLLSYVITQLFRNIYYQEFYYTGRQIQLNLKTSVSLWKL